MFSLIFTFHSRASSEDWPLFVQCVSSHCCSISEVCLSSGEKAGGVVDTGVTVLEGRSIWHPWGPMPAPRPLRGLSRAAAAFVSLRSWPPRPVPQLPVL